MTKKPEIYGHGYRIKVIFRDFDYEESDLNAKKSLAKKLETI